jgi:hypothetical protein
LDWLADAKRSIARWNSVAAEFDIAPQGGSLDAACKATTALQDLVENTHQLAFSYDAKLHAEIEKVFGKQVADRVWDAPEITIKTVTESLRAHVDKGRLAYAMGRVGELVMKLDRSSGAVVPSVPKSYTDGAQSRRPSTLALPLRIPPQTSCSRSLLRSPRASYANPNDYVRAIGPPAFLSVQVPRVSVRVLAAKMIQHGLPPLATHHRSGSPQPSALYGGPSNTLCFDRSQHHQLRLVLLVFVLKVQRIALRQSDVDKLIQTESLTEHSRLAQVLLGRQLLKSRHLSLC